MSRRRAIQVNAAACALRALALLGRVASTKEVARVAGYTPRRLRTVLPQLAVALGAGHDLEGRTDVELVELILARRP